MVPFPTSSASGSNEHMEKENAVVTFIVILIVGRFLYWVLTSPDADL
jgi:hypothetical protein